MEFNIGDRVVCVEAIFGFHCTLNKHGRIIWCDGCNYGVEFEENVSGHNCDGHEADGHTYPGRDVNVQHQQYRGNTDPREDGHWGSDRVEHHQDISAKNP